MTAATISPPSVEVRGPSAAQPAKLLLGLIGSFAVGWLIANTFLSLAYYPEWYFNNRIVMGLVGMLAGIGGAALLFYCINVFVEGLPQKFQEGLIPYAFLLPAFALIALMLLYPAAQTVNYAFANNNSTRYVGLDNFKAIFSDGEFWIALTNNALWLIIVPAVTVALGVVVALFADRLSATGEKVSKALVFLPMAISFVAASTIWGKLIYDANPNVGMLNAILGTENNWIRISDGRLNSLLMMVILIWMQTGFAMVLLSGAIKNVPEETLEAARIDGANERQIFFKVIIPQIKGTIITVFITVVILVLKVFDIVYVLTNGQARTNVIALMFFQELFTAGRAGRASAIVVVLLILVMPILFYQVRHYRKEQAR
ncbi:alpha-glucoside transport system permease protein [Ruaniaceae bacterium KH17]|nr:alpha-glucoside transport system permease protein [Ruaniaceae bacterium KH17]